MSCNYRKPVSQLAGTMLIAAVATMLLFSVATVLAQPDYNECGVLFEGVTCPVLFEPDSGGVGLIFSPDLPNFQIGDRVRVRGIYDPTCFSICLQQNFCVHEATVRYCSLLEVSELTGGEIGNFRLTRGRPGQRQYLVYSLHGPGETFVSQLNVTLDLRQPVLATSGVTDSQGSILWRLRVPQAASGRDVWFQVAQTGITSNVVERRVR